MDTPSKEEPSLEVAPTVINVEPIDEASANVGDIISDPIDDQHNDVTIDDLPIPPPSTSAAVADAVASVTQVREFHRPPSAASFVSDANSTPPRSPTRGTPPPPLAPSSTSTQHQHRTRHRASYQLQQQQHQPLQQPSHHHHQHNRRRSPRHQTSAHGKGGPPPTVDSLIDDDVTTPSDSPHQQHHHHPPHQPPHSSSGSNNYMTGLPVKSVAIAAQLPRVHRRQHPQPHHGVGAAAAIATAASAFAAVDPMMGAATTAATAASPAHRKRSKSESRRRRERKMIAAGELEVRQANETLMRYLRQCTEINDASLSGELEIDQSYDDRRVQRKTRSQRERRGYVAGVSTTSVAAAGLAAAGGAGVGGAGGVAAARGRLQLQNGLTSILNSLVEDIRPMGAEGGVGGGGVGTNGGAADAEIYNPFTPVISPSEGAPMGLGSKIFGQHSHRRYVDGGGSGDGVEDGFRVDGMMEHGLDEYNHSQQQTIVDISCNVQRYWILLANLCHGVLGGLALAHLLLVMTTNPYDWLGGGNGGGNGGDVNRTVGGFTFANAYTSTFYALAVVCLVSVLDRMDFCRLNSSFSDTISFRWIIVLLIYLATNILILSTQLTSADVPATSANSTEWMDKVAENRVLDVWNSLTIVRSVFALLGWLMVGIFPHDDMLFDHLADMERHQLH